MLPESDGCAKSSGLLEVIAPHANFLSCDTHWKAFGGLGDNVMAAFNVLYHLLLLLMERNGHVMPYQS